MRDSEASELYLSASEGRPSPGSDWDDEAGSVCSVDSEELQELLEELQIVPPRQQPGGGKRRLALDEGPDEATSPTSQRPSASPRLEAGGSARPAAAAAPPPRPVAAATTAATAAGGAEVIDLLSSSSSEEDSEDEWHIAAPGTSQKR